MIERELLELEETHGLGARFLIVKQGMTIGAFSFATTEMKLIRSRFVRSSVRQSRGCTFVLLVFQ